MKAYRYIHCNQLCMDIHINVTMYCVNGYSTGNATELSDVCLLSQIHTGSIHVLKNQVGVGGARDFRGLVFSFPFSPVFGGCVLYMRVCILYAPYYGKQI